MAITINGVEHDQDLFLSDDFATPSRLGARRQTCGAGGLTVIQGVQSEIKKVLVLTASFDGGAWLGHWTLGQVKALQALEKSGSEFAIVYEDTSYQAVVAPGGLADLAPRNPRPNAEDSDWYYGSVIFWEV